MKIPFAYCMTALALLAGSPAGAVTFQDSNFNNISVAAEYNSDAANTTGSAMQCPTCGVGSTSGLHTQVTFSANAASGQNNLPQTTFGIVENAFTYNPLTQGAIGSISASVDKDFSSTESATGITNTFRPLIEQGGNFYLAAISGGTLNGPGTTGYKTISGTGLTASDFKLFDFSTGTFGTANPNFDGAPITFGLAQNFNLQDGTTNIADYDNLTLSISAVPEISTWAMMLLGLCGLGFMGYRRANRGSLAFA